jgi:CheY-like chemotaxis protein
MAGLELEGRRVLVVEDELVMAMELEMALRDQGAEVVGPVASVALALREIDGKAPPDLPLTSGRRPTSAASIHCEGGARLAPLTSCAQSATSMNRTSAAL